MIDEYNKKVYGSVDFEPIIKDLLNSKSLQRLKLIQQHGPDAWIWEHANITRFEHSLGVFLLLKRLNAPLKEQIAGLIHDASHTAFSHVTDFAFDKIHSADFHEHELDFFLKSSDIPLILDKFNFNVKDLYDHKQFPLLEKNIPDLCADRIDYFFRDSYKYGLISMEDIEFMLNSLIVHNNDIVFNNEQAAFLFGKKYLKAAKKIFGSKLSIYYYTVLGKALNIAIEKEFLSKEDLFTTDDEVKEKLIKSNDPEIIKRINLISDKTRLEKADKDNHDYNLRVKTRVVDPKILVDGSLKRLSEVNPEFKNLLEESKINQKNGYYVNVFSE